LKTQQEVRQAFDSLPFKIIEGLQDKTRLGSSIPVQWVSNIRNTAKSFLHNIIDLAQYADENRDVMPQSAIHLISTMKFYLVLMKIA
jgi:hypothetical protein